MSIQIKHPGAYHRHLGLPEGAPIPQSAINRDLKSPDSHVRMMANFANNARHFKHPKHPKWHEMAAGMMRRPTQRSIKSHLAEGMMQ